MSKIETIVVGLPVRNEEKSLYASLKSIRDAVKDSKEDKIRIVICINGCTDKSEFIAEKFKKDHPDIRCDIIQSIEGLINAQRKIVELYNADVYVFPDADNIIDKNSINLLLRSLRLDSNLVVAYAKTKVLQDEKNKSLFHQIGLLYDTQRILTKRYYFHGRLFATREWFVPTDEEILKHATRSRRNAILLKYCDNRILLSADDIFMSSYIMDKYGLKAIKQIDEAICYSWSVGSLRDWSNIYRRRNIEMEKMYRWFPEYNYLKPYLNRHTDWKKWFGVGVRDKLLWLTFLLMRNAFVVLLSLEFLLSNLNFYKPRKQWVIASTTKKPFHAKNNFL